MEISHSSWPWHRSDATALAGYVNMTMMMMWYILSVNCNLSAEIQTHIITSKHQLRLMFSRRMLKNDNHIYQTAVLSTMLYAFSFSCTAVKDGLCIVNTSRHWKHFASNVCKAFKVFFGGGKGKGKRGFVYHLVVNTPLMRRSGMACILK